MCQRAPACPSAPQRDEQSTLCGGIHTLLSHTLILNAHIHTHLSPRTHTSDIHTHLSRTHSPHTHSSHTHLTHTHLTHLSHTHIHLTYALISYTCSSHTHRTYTHFSPLVKCQSPSGVRLCNPADCSPPLCPWDSPGKNTGVGCHALLWGSPRPRARTRVSCTQAGPSPSKPAGKPSPEQGAAPVAHVSSPHAVWPRQSEVSSRVPFCQDFQASCW